ITSVLIVVNPPGGSLAVPSSKNTPTSTALASFVSGEWKEGGPGTVLQVQVPQPKIQPIDTHLKVAKIDGRLPIAYPAGNKSLIYVFGYNAQEAGDSLDDTTVQDLRSLGYEGGTKTRAAVAGTMQDLLDAATKIKMAKRVIRAEIRKAAERRVKPCPHCGQVNQPPAKKPKHNPAASPQKAKK
ncbi:unnamed protein product, partial [Symbiodinium sp. CCMP2456]